MSLRQLNCDKASSSELDCSQLFFQTSLSKRYQPKLINFILLLEQPLELIYEHSGNFIYSTKNTIPGHLKTLVNTARDISLTNVYCLWRDIYKNRPCYLCYRIQTPAKPGLKLFQIVWLKICFWNFCLLFFYRFKTIMFFHKLLLKAEIKQYILDYSIGKQ